MNAAPLTREERLGKLVLELLTGGTTRPELDRADWRLLTNLAGSHAVLARLATRLGTLGVRAPRDFVSAAGAERARAAAMLDLLRHLQATCARHAIAWMVPKALQRYPDVGDDVDILVCSRRASIDGLVLEGLPATATPPTIAMRVAGSTEYTVAPGGAQWPRLVLDIHHGRVGSAGQHTGFADALARNGRAVTVAGTVFRVPSPEDQLVLQGLEKVSGRRRFHLCDVLQTIQVVQEPRLDWDYVLATVRAHGGWEGMSCYLRYVDGVHTRLLGRELVPAEPRRALALEGWGWGHPQLGAAGFQFPALRVTGRVFRRQLGRAVGAGNWDAALRLSLWPLGMIAARLGRVVHA
jgi:Uncharacterised nucleotidyltransferase